MPLNFLSENNANLAEAEKIKKIGKIIEKSFKKNKIDKIGIQWASTSSQLNENLKAEIQLCIQSGFPYKDAIEAIKTKMHKELTIMDIELWHFDKATSPSKEFLQYAENYYYNLLNIEKEIHKIEPSFKVYEQMDAEKYKEHAELIEKKLQQAQQMMGLSNEMTETTENSKTNKMK